MADNLGAVGRRERRRQADVDRRKEEDNASVGRLVRQTTGGHRWRCSTGVDKASRNSSSNLHRRRHHRYGRGLDGHLGGRSIDSPVGGGDRLERQTSRVRQPVRHRRRCDGHTSPCGAVRRPVSYRTSLHGDDRRVDAGRHRPEDQSAQRRLESVGVDRNLPTLGLTVQKETERTRSATEAIGLRLGKLRH